MQELAVVDGAEGAGPIQLATARLLIDKASQHMDTGRGDLDGALERARRAVSN